MKIAVTYENGQIFQHFGHSKQFKIYDIQEKSICSSEVMEVIGSGHGALAEMLKNAGVEALICGGIGGGAQTALKEAAIKLYPGVSGEADEQVRAYLEDRLIYNPDVTCSHHGSGHHHEHGDCTSHK